MDLSGIDSKKSACLTIIAMMDDRSSLPKVSIIIPCFNAQRTIQEAVSSALEQTYPSSEVIVIDDGSTDDSLSKIQAFGDRIELISGPNFGGSTARNRGVLAASGEFVQFLDADDLLHPEKLARSVATSRAVPSNAIVVSDWRRILLNPNRDVEEHSFPSEPTNMLEAALFYGLQTAAPLHRRQTLLEIGGFREHLRCCQEKDLHLRLVAARYEFKRLAFPGVTVRQTAGSVSSDNVKVLLQRREVLCNLVRLLEASNCDSGWRSTVASALTRDSFDLINVGLVREARPNLDLAYHLDPEKLGRRGVIGLLPRILIQVFGVQQASALYAILKSSFRSAKSSIKIPN